MLLWKAARSPMQYVYPLSTVSRDHPPRRRSPMTYANSTCSLRQVGDREQAPHEHLRMWKAS